MNSAADAKSVGWTRPKGVLGPRTVVGATAVLALVSVVLLDATLSMAARSITGIPLFVADLLVHGSTIPLVFLALALGGAAELNRLLMRKDCRPFTRLSYAAITLIMLMPWFSAAGWLGQRAVDLEGLYWSLIATALSVVAVMFATVWRGDPAGSIRDTAATLLVIMYVGLLPSFAVQIRCDRDLPEQDGVWVLLTLLLVTKATDIGGFFAGLLFGKHKLIPSISPAKSIEGAIGAAAASMLVAMFLTCATRWIEVVPINLRVHHFDNFSVDLLKWVDIVGGAFQRGSGFLSQMPEVRACLFGLIISITAQFGDLVESSFKRDAGAKDSGSVIPRAGGILDLIDSPLTCVPVGWFLLTAFWRIA